VKVRIHYDDRPVGEGELAPDGSVKWSGDTDTLRGVVGYYERQGLTGDGLLRALLLRLRGHWWAEEVTDEGRRALRGGTA
jgi:hypothetical protein